MARTNWHWKRVNQNWDSKFEKTLQEGVLSHCEFHNKEKTYEYTISHKYHPDFIWTDANGRVFLIESKGNFETTNDASKYRHIRDHLPENTELVFCFMNGKTKMPRARKRKDGTFATVSEWAERHGFQWFTEDTIKELFMNDKELGKAVIEAIGAITYRIEKEPSNIEIAEVLTDVLLILTKLGNYNRPEELGYMLRKLGTKILSTEVIRDEK